MNRVSSPETELESSQVVVHCFTGEVAPFHSSSLYHEMGKPEHKVSSEVPFKFEDGADKDTNGKNKSLANVDCVGYL